MLVFSFLAEVFGVSLLASPQDSAAKSTIEQQLKTQYALTRVGANGVVTQPGSILVIQQDGIKAVPASYQGYFANSVKKGARIKPNVIQHIGGGGSGFHPAYLDEARLLQVGDKAYLTKVEINKDTEIVFSLQSCGVCDPAGADQNNPPFRASLTFQFAKGYLETADFKDVQQTIGQVFGVDNSVAAQSTQQPKEPEQVPAAPSEQVEPTTITVGQTKEQVVTVLGQPQRIAKAGNKEIYFYKDLKVTFVDDKVSDFQ
jgi:hypothetical protein